LIENKPHKKFHQDEEYKKFSGNSLLLMEAANTYGMINNGMCGIAEK
jgi:hypothetical protein